MQPCWEPLAKEQPESSRNNWLALIVSCAWFHQVLMVSSDQINLVAVFAWWQKDVMWVVSMLQFRYSPPRFKDVATLQMLLRV